MFALNSSDNITSTPPSRLALSVNRTRDPLKVGVAVCSMVSSHLDSVLGIRTKDAEY
jgi:hypothetical protein